MGPVAHGHGYFLVGLSDLHQDESPFAISSRVVSRFLLNVRICLATLSDQQTQTLEILVVVVLTIQTSQLGSMSVAR